MKKILALLLCLAMVFCLFGCGQSEAPAQESTQEESVELIVFAAASMTETLNEIAGMYKEAAPNVELVFNFDSSGTLQTQIEEGADCDLFISAAPKQMNALDGALGAMSEGGRIALGVAVAALMAADMGGPLNKAAYVFATSTLAAVSPAVGSVVMACAMAGGMVPPLAIALCCTFFPNRFRPAERRSGLVNYIMGLCFITEGAIPFAASDPARVIPACVAGSALAGGLAAFFNCALPAPHGGIFVFPVIRNVPGYLIALAAGSLAGMLVLALLRKKQA